MDLLISAFIYLIIGLSINNCIIRVKELSALEKLNIFNNNENECLELADEEIKTFTEKDLINCLSMNLITILYQE